MQLDRRDLPVLFRMIVSLVILILCVCMLFDRNLPSDYTKWAFGMIGIVVGYWLK
jgi:hypothetical protein